MRARFKTRQRRYPTSRNRRSIIGNRRNGVFLLQLGESERPSCAFERAAIDRLVPRSWPRTARPLHRPLHRRPLT